MSAERALGLLAVVGVGPLAWRAVLALASRDYLAGALLVFALLGVGRLGVELLALDRRRVTGEDA